MYARRVIGDPKAEVKSDFFVPVDVFNLATRTRLDYLDASIKPFAPDSVVKLSFTHGKETYELERADDGKAVAQATWKINAPERLKGRRGRPAQGERSGHEPVVPAADAGGRRPADPGRAQPPGGEPRVAPAEGDGDDQGAGGPVCTCSAGTPGRRSGTST